MKLIDYLKNNSKKFPNKIALICGKESFTYTELEEKIKRLSYGLTNIGIKKNDHLTVILNNSIEFFITLYAAANLGAVIIPANSTLSKKDLINQIKITNTKYIIGWHATLKDLFGNKESNFPIKKKNCIVVGNRIKNCKRFGDLMNQLPDNYILGKVNFLSNTNFIFGLTSGSTSEPKVIKFSQKTKILRSLHAKNLYNLDNQDVVVVSTPMHHSISQRLLILPVVLGGTCVIMEKFTNKNWLLTVETYGITFSIVVATQLELIFSLLQSKKKYKTKSLKTLISCCSHLKKEIKLKLSKKLNCEIHDTYGASEVGTITNLNINKEINKSHTLGVTAPNVDITFLNDLNNKQNKDQAGEILCKTPLQFSGYYKNEKLTKKTISNGYFLTGDIGYLDNEGYLILTGRKKDIIITGGINVHASDIEKVLNLHPKISESAVIGLKDKRLGEAIFAIIIPNSKTKLDLNELKRYCATNLADYQQPLGYDFVSNFPRGTLNKIRKQKLIQKYKYLDLSKKVRKTLENTE